MPDLKIDQFNIDINVLGLRNLVSTGLLPVKKAFTKFSVKSILPPAQAKAVADIYTQPGEGGTDPNVRVTLKIQVKIPGEVFYCPSMTCSIQDKLYFDGMRQPILGTFTLKLGQILSDTRALDKEEFANQEYFNKILTKAIGLKKGAVHTELWVKSQMTYRRMAFKSPKPLGKEQQMTMQAVKLVSMMSKLVRLIQKNSLK